MLQKALANMAKQVVERTTKHQHFGLYAGTTEFAHDPLMLRRVKVRIPLFHGDLTVTPTNQLPWADKCEMSGGGFDYGSSMPLIPGCGVWCMFRDGDPDYPVVIGTYNSIPAKRSIHGNTEPDYMPIDEQDSSFGMWKGQEVIADDGTGKGVTEINAETRRESFHEPTITMPFKTWKGASLEIEDKDARERMEILDRSGQGIQFQSRITKDLNKYNKMQRGLRSVFNGNQFDYKEHTDNRESSISFRDLAQQGVQTEARKYAERAKIVSNSANSAEELLDMDSSQSFHAIELQSGHRRTVIEGRKQGQTMFKMSFDSQRGILNIETENAVKISSQKVYIEAPDITFKGDVLLDGDIIISGDSTVIGAQTSGTPERDKPIRY